MDYLLQFPSKIRSSLEAVVLSIGLKHRLTGHLFGTTARSAALAYVVEMYCAVALELCEAVEIGEYPYDALTPSLTYLISAIMADAHRQASLWDYARYETGHRAEALSRDGFARAVTEALEVSGEWRAIQARRSELARKQSINQGTLTTGPTSEAKETDSQPALSNERLISVQKAARRLGVSDDTVQRMQDDGRLARRSVGRLRRVISSEIDRLIESGDYPKRS
jgi:excisionase family DNA binding protein